jgi:PAS domain S-box-containing protein
VTTETDPLYYRLVEAAPDAILVFDANGSRCLLANAAAERLLGYGRAELLRLRPVDLLDPDQLPRGPRERQDVETTGYWRGDTRLRRKDGSVVSVEATYARHEHDGRVLYQSVFRDLAGRKQAEVVGAQHGEPIEVVATDAAPKQVDQGAGAVRRLTPREREVAVVVASGLTNEQIAERLVLESGTVSNHVEHILRKLGFSRRSQIAAWAVACGLYRPVAHNN